MKKLPQKTPASRLNREIAEVLLGGPSYPDAGLRQRIDKALTYAVEPSSKTVDFFRKHSGYAVRSGESKVRAKARAAQALARAEAEAEARGWIVYWEDDPEKWQGDVPRPFEVLTAVLRDADGYVLTSLGGIGMTGNSRVDDDYRRVIEAELAAEALSLPSGRLPPPPRNRGRR